MITVPNHIVQRYSLKAGDQMQLEPCPGGGFTVTPVPKQKPPPRYTRST